MAIDVADCLNLTPKEGNEMRKNPSLTNKYGSRQKDGGAHIDVLMSRAGVGGSRKDFDWKPSVGPAFRKRDATGAFEIGSEGNMYKTGRK